MPFRKTQSDDANSILGEKSIFTGKFFINGSLKVEGIYEGQALQSEHLVITKKGKVKTDISATNVVVEGIVIGNIHAKKRVLLAPSAKVLGDIHTPELIIQNGVIWEGKCYIHEDQSINIPEVIEKEYYLDEKI